MRELTVVGWLAASSLGLLGCFGADAPTGPRGRLALTVAPLNLSGVTDADYTLTVHNGPNGTGDVVWTKALSSSAYGDGAGSLSYVGPCDASTGVNTVTLTLVALHDTSGVVPVASYMNPTPVARQITCLENADVALAFDITMARQADQGFFDVAVQFSDVFCAAKLDCQDALGNDLDLLHNAAGARDLTVVMGFACTGSLSGTTYLYLDDPVIRCSGLAQDVRVDPTGVGNVSLTTAPSANANGYLFGASVYRGVEGFAGKAYWNVSFGLDATRFAAAGTCVLTARGTASDVAFPQEVGGFPLPEGSVYPVIDWQVTLSDATHRVCTRHEVNQVASGVATNYLGYLPLFNGFSWSPDPIYLKHRFEPASGIVLSAGTPICNPSCAHGVCTATDVCDCATTGYTGDLCATPLCTAPCQNGGTCTAPEVCTCPAGFYGPTCASACGAVAHCAVTPTCTTADDAVCPSCTTPYLPNGAGACVQCLTVAHCDDDANPCTVKTCDANVCGQAAGNPGAACRAAAGDCDVAEACDGLAALCPTDAFVAVDTECRAAFGLCDVAERCTGSAAACPADAAAPDTTTCRVAAGACDVAERCDGSGKLCPADAFEADSVVCNPAAGVCDLPELCTGSAAACPADVLAAGGTECRAVSGLCDVAEDCTGAAVDCPADAFLSNATLCRAAADVCDLAEHCTGSAAACPADAFVVADTECRAAAGDCDLAETCTGSATSCPANAFKASGVACGSATDTTCDLADTCDGGGTCLANYAPSTTVCRADAGACDVVETCDGSGACPADAFEPDGTACPNSSFCDGAETCTAGVCLDRSDPCPTSTSVCDEAGDGCVPIYTSCVDAFKNGATASGLYFIDPDLGGAIPTLTAYCDQTTAVGGVTGGWMLMAKFTQHQTISSVDGPSVYAAYFGSTTGTLWVDGHAMATPTAPTLPADSAYHFESVDWGRYLVAGARYQLRQNFFKAAGAQTFDATFRFTYNGHVKQDATTPEWLRAWQLLDRQVIYDTTGITWNVEPDYHLFWLPFSATATGTLYTGCAGYAFATDGCTKDTPAWRRYGNAGITGRSADNTDPAAAWAPHMNGNPTHDVVYVHQAPSTYGTTGAPMALLYWVREERCATASQCDSGYCDTTTGLCAAYQPSCLALYSAGQHTDGTYHIDPDGASGSGAPFAAVCDMANGGWTRVALEDFESGTPSGWSYTNTLDSGASLASVTTITTCGAYGALLGGYGVLSNGYLLKTFSHSAALPHSEARLNLDFVKIDSWDSENAWVNFTDPAINPNPATGANWTQNLGSSGVQQCGAISPGWDEARIGVTLTIAHSSDNLTVRASTDLSSGALDESWGVDNVRLWIR